MFIELLYYSYSRFLSASFLYWWYKRETSSLVAPSVLLVDGVRGYGLLVPVSLFGVIGGILLIAEIKSTMNKIIDESFL